MFIEKQTAAQNTHFFALLQSSSSSTYFNYDDHAFAATSSVMDLRTTISALSQILLAFFF